MQMQTKRNKDAHVPAQGGLGSLFTRLRDYITVYDEEWARRIKPAEEEMVRRVRGLCGMEDSGMDFPESYQIFLKTMGEDDGGLVSVPMLGSPSISDIIEFYEDLKEDDEEALNTPYFTFFLDTFGALELSFQMAASENPPVVETESGELVRAHAENFEKFLFQCAFRQYGRGLCHVNFSGSEYSVGELLKSLNSKHIFNEVEKFLLEYQYQRAWFSDDKHYIGYSDHTRFLICYNGGVFGFMSGDDECAVKNMADVLMRRIGAEVCLP